MFVTSLYKWLCNQYKIIKYIVDTRKNEKINNYFSLFTCMYIIEPMIQFLLLLPKYIYTHYNDGTVNYLSMNNSLNFFFFQKYLTLFVINYNLI